MPQYLIILITVLVILAILVLLILFWFIRRSLNVLKKVDYLVEDITFKSESIKPVFDATITLSNYVNTLEKVANENLSDLVNLFSNNNVEMQAIIENIKKIMVNSQKSNIVKTKNLPSKSKKNEENS